MFDTISRCKRKMVLFTLVHLNNVILKHDSGSVNAIGLNGKKSIPTLRLAK